MGCAETRAGEGGMEFLRPEWMKKVVFLRHPQVDAGHVGGGTDGMTQQHRERQETNGRARSSRPKILLLISTSIPLPSPSLSLSLPLFFTIVKPTSPSITTPPSPLSHTSLIPRESPLLSPSPRCPPWFPRIPITVGPCGGIYSSVLLLLGGERPLPLKLMPF